VALVDIRMPKANGFEVLQAIRSQPHLTGTYVFAVTAFAMEGDRQKALLAGFDGYLAKPISRKELISTIKTALQSPRDGSGKP
ncbi:MAG TPA: response regulator, partial [Terriglobales bacterium]|nr:response regulator [Terriglobales bacterium]